MDILFPTKQYHLQRQYNIEHTADNLKSYMNHFKLYRQINLDFISTMFSWRVQMKQLNAYLVGT